MKKMIFALIGLTLALLLPSCLECEITITVNKDGSGTIVEDWVYAASAVQNAAAWNNTLSGIGGDSEGELSEMEAKRKQKATLEERAKSFGEGVTLFKIEEIERNDGSRSGRVIYKFTDINKITNAPTKLESAFSSMKPKSEDTPQKDAEVSRFKYSNGILTVRAPKPVAKKKKKKKPAEADDRLENAMADLWTGLKLSSKLVIADGIAETNATFVEGNTVTLVALDYDKARKSAASLATMDKSKLKSLAILRAGAILEGYKIEKKEITVKIK
ncbi:MAG: hypothetical protein ABF391_17845 [Akkermansiaceae bacterium]